MVDTHSQAKLNIIDKALRTANIQSKRSFSGLPTSTLINGNEGISFISDVLDAKESNIGLAMFKQDVSTLIQTYANETARKDEKIKSGCSGGHTFDENATLWSTLSQYKQHTVGIVEIYCVPVTLLVEVIHHLMGFYYMIFAKTFMGTSSGNTPGRNTRGGPDEKEENNIMITTPSPMSSTQNPISQPLPSLSKPMHMASSPPPNLQCRRGHGRASFNFGSGVTGFRARQSYRGGYGGSGRSVAYCQSGPANNYAKMYFTSGEHCSHSNHGGAYGGSSAHPSYHRGSSGHLLYPHDVYIGGKSGGSSSARIDHKCPSFVDRTRTPLDFLDNIRWSFKSCCFRIGWPVLEEALFPWYDPATLKEPIRHIVKALHSSKTIRMMKDKCAYVALDRFTFVHLKASMWRYRNGFEIMQKHFQDVATDTGASNRLQEIMLRMSPLISQLINFAIAPSVDYYEYFDKNNNREWYQFSLKYFVSTEQIHRQQLYTLISSGNAINGTDNVYYWLEPELNGIDLQQYKWFSQRLRQQIQSCRQHQNMIY